ncbi:MAG TPA: aminotransferase class IV [Niastella sp.]
MDQYLYYNGAILPADAPLITAGNRGLRYGDGLFETIKVTDGAMPLFQLHMERMWHGLSILQMELPQFYTPDYIQETIINLCRHNNTLPAARVRITIIRGNGTLYSSNSPHASIIIQSEPLGADYLALNTTGFTLDVYTEVQKSCDLLSNLKSNNYLPYVMAGLYSRKQQLNDCLLLNSHGRICDATIANVFWVHNNHIFTPPLSEGGVAGVMRKHLLYELPNAGYIVHEKPCTVASLEAADEMFLTNALYGIRWVQQFGTKLYSNQFIKELYERFVKTGIPSQLS